MYIVRANTSFPGQDLYGMIHSDGKVDLTAHLDLAAKFTSPNDPYATFIEEELRFKLPNYNFHITEVRL